MRVLFVPMKLPNFFIVGAGKTGTTSLYRYLRQHPQIYMSPIKEPSFFASEIRAENLSDAFERRTSQQFWEVDGGARVPWLVSDWEHYAKLFQNVTEQQKAIGEATPSYLWSETAAVNIRSRIPNAKIIMILRDPAERAFSHYLHQLAEGLTRSTFREHIEKCMRGGIGKLSAEYPFLELGLYYRQVKRYLDAFPRDQVRIYWYEEAWRQPQRLLADLFEFLNVDGAFEPDTTQRSLQRRAPRVVALNYFLKNQPAWSRLWKVVPDPLRARLRRLAFHRPHSLVMDPRDRRYLIEYYREDVQKLASLLNRDLDRWLECP